MAETGWRQRWKLRAARFFVGCAWVLAAAILALALERAMG